KSVLFEAEDFLFLRRFIGPGVFEEHRKGIERVQFLFHPFFENQIVERACALWLRRGFDLAETLPPRGDTGEKPGEVLVLLRRERLTIDCSDWQALAVHPSSSL